MSATAPVPAPATEATSEPNAAPTARPLTAPPMRVGVTPDINLWSRPWAERRRRIELVAEAGFDHVFFADHVSFRTGHGNDGMVTAAALANLHPDLGVYLGVYLLPLRHPVPVARQLANLAEMAPGRISFGVGIGGDDRHEVELCGVDPRTRGRRADESLGIVLRLLAGEAVDHRGEFFSLSDARITPTPDPPIGVYVGGRSDAAVRRAGRFADGWLGTWCSAERYRAALSLFAETAQTERAPAAAAPARRAHAERAGPARAFAAADHGLQLWVGIGESRQSASACVGPELERFYRVPFAAFEKYTPCGTVDDVVDFFMPYLEAGCRHVNMTPCAADPDEAILAAGEVARRLREADPLAESDA
ncbi:LLM class flavin-dependent oxidoreductase [Candidatus Poriferisodalis sp.]|uniref:LLM class flavin-dependent oxidoreductase n=1 Tax=Candidatus Poriferisodalis sp. TaxID=3101277 RepID=UPI003B0156AD